MRDFKNFRPLNEREIKIIHTALDLISSHLSSFLEKIRFSLFISYSEHEIRQQVYLISESIQKLILSINNHANINSAGLYFGFLSGNTFFLGIEGAEFFLKENLIPDQNILAVNNKGEKAVLYGNPIIKKMVLNVPPNMQKDTIMIVLNKLKEPIALVRSNFDYNSFKLLNQGDLVANNLIDKGYYLRRQQ